MDKIKTWQERCIDGLHNFTSFADARDAEIAELRAALASQASKGAGMERDAARWRAYRVSAAAAMSGLHSDALDSAVDKLVDFTPSPAQAQPVAPDIVTLAAFLAQAVQEYPDFDGDNKDEPRPLVALAKQLEAACEAVQAQPVADAAPILWAALNLNGDVVYSHGSRENVSMNAGYIKTPTRIVGLVAQPSTSQGDALSQQSVKEQPAVAARKAVINYVRALTSKPSEN